MQRQKVFFNFNGKMKSLPDPPTDSDIRLSIAENNQSCPLTDIVVSTENEGNIRNLRRFAFTALKNPNRTCRGCNFGIYSPPGQGKTFIVKKFAATIGIPFIFVQSPALENTHMLFEQICEAFAKFGTPIVEIENKKYNFCIPPCIIFFDEAHALKDSMMKGSLLNAMEPDDAMMVFKQPGKKGRSLIADCSEVCWVGATTERGELFDAFESRLTTAIEWHPASIKDLTDIVFAGLKKKFDAKEIPFFPSKEICEMICQYQATPRLAIHGFGTKVVQHKAYMPSFTWEECCKIVAKDMGINHWGFTKKQMNILTALGQRPIAEMRLADVAKCRIAQVKKYELPNLMQYNNGGPFVVSVSSKGMCITKSGLKKLDEMGVPHKGENISAEYFEGKR